MQKSIFYLSVSPSLAQSLTLRQVPGCGFCVSLCLGVPAAGLVASCFFPRFAFSQASRAFFICAYVLAATRRHHSLKQISLFLL